MLGTRHFNNHASRGIGSSPRLPGDANKQDRSVCLLLRQFRWAAEARRRGGIATAAESATCCLTTGEAPSLPALRQTGRFCSAAFWFSAAVLSRELSEGKSIRWVGAWGWGKKVLNNSKKGKKKEKRRANIWHLSTERQCPAAEEETDKTARVKGGEGDSLAEQRFPDAAAQCWR